VIIYYVIRERESIERSYFLDIRLFKQQKKMITHTHEQTDIKKREREKEGA